MSVNFKSQSLFKRAFLENEFQIDLRPSLNINTSKEQAWQYLKQPQNGFERFALRTISKLYILPRKPFVLSEVMIEICEQWEQFDNETKYYLSVQ